MPHLDGELPTPELAAIRAETAAALAQNEALGDAADRRRAELGLLETSSLLRSVLDSALETSIIVTNADLTIKVFNAGAERLFGYTGDEVIDKLTLMNLHNPLELEARCAEAGAADSLLHAAALVAPASIGRARDGR